MSFPDVNWGQVPGDIINSLVKGFQKEFLSGHPTPGTPNAITGLLKLLTGALGPLGGLGDILNGLPGLITQQISPLAANALPSADAKMVTLSTDPDGDASTGKHAASADTPVPDDTGATAKHGRHRDAHHQGRGRRRESLKIRAWNRHRRPFAETARTRQH